MSKMKNYSKMYAAEEDKVIPVEVPVAVLPKVEDEPESKNALTVTGVVVDCFKLNVREQMNSSAAVLCVLPANSEVQVITGCDHDEWYHIFTEAGIEGFCMKKYIRL